jgi:tetratricopeptide (TPR) repeat protein
MHRGVSLLLFAATFVSGHTTSAQTGVPSQQLTHELQQAQMALKAKDESEAAAHFRAALKLDPLNVEANANLGVMAFFHVDCPNAEPSFRNALKAAPTLTKVRALLAVCEKKLGEPGAQADLADAFDRLTEPRLRTQVGGELADLYYQQGDLGQAASVLSTLSTINPDNVDILFFEQRVYSELADSALNKLAVLAPDSARMQQLIAERLINEGDLKGAIDHYRKALQIDPRLAGMHLELAESLMEGSPNNAATQREATAELSSAISVDGDSAKIECELGRIALLQLDLSKALSHYQRAYQLNPENAQAEMGMADVLRAQDKPEEAVKYLRMAVDSDPLNAKAHYKLSEVDMQLHLENEQRKQLKLFEDIRTSQEKIQLLHQQMEPEAPKSNDKNSSKVPQ